MPLEDLQKLLADTVNDSSHNYSDEDEGDANGRLVEQVIPLMQSPNEQKVRVHSSVARTRGIPYKLMAKQHPYQLAFALTDYKLKGGR